MKSIFRCLCVCVKLHFKYILSIIPCFVVAADKEVDIVLNTAFSHHLAEYATDGVTICPYSESFLHTHFTSNPWLKILFDQTVDVALVVVYNRQKRQGVCTCVL
jgi:hypothetical protein